MHTSILKQFPEKGVVSSVYMYMFLLISFSDAHDKCMYLCSVLKAKVSQLG